MAALGEPPTPQDALPTVEGERAPQQVDAASARYLGSTSAAEYWVALDEAGSVCVVQSLTDGAAHVSCSCAPADRFSRSGVWVDGRTGDTSATGLVVPDDFHLADAQGDEDWVMVGDNLAAPADQVG